MAQPSPSEFLTFYRTVTLAATRGPSLLSRRPRFNTLPTRRPFSTTPTQPDEARKDEAGKRPIHREDAHVLKKDGYDVQSENAKRGKADHDAGTGGNATARRDETQSTQRAKEEHPEAPDVVIGMQDERGQKGH